MPGLSLPSDEALAKQITPHDNEPDASALRAGDGVRGAHADMDRLTASQLAFAQALEAITRPSVRGEAPLSWYVWKERALDHV